MDFREGSLHLASRHPNPPFSNDIEPDDDIENLQFSTESPHDDHAVAQLSRDNCDRRRPAERDPSRLVNISPQLVGTAVTPFLREHIPGVYAPAGKPELQSPTAMKDSNSKYCYRHRPDALCRRAADESKMEMIQDALEKLPAADQQAITYVWSLFSAAPAKHRDLMLQGIVTQSCFPQLSTISREIQDQLKIDFLTALPVEISYKILCYLDTVSLCKAAQVCRRWRDLADDDTVWHNLCKQHIARKCTKCGWGLPLLERERLQNWSRDAGQQTLTPTPPRDDSPEPEDAGPPHPQGGQKRPTDDQAVGHQEKKLCADPNGVAAHPAQRAADQDLVKLPWKDVYRRRFRVGSNWKYGRCSVRIFKGHRNGITCLQFNDQGDDKIMATGSYDATIKIWSLETGQEVRTLEGHTMGIRTLQFDENKLISGSLDKTIKIWNWQTGECVNTLRYHTEGVISVYSVGKYLVSGSIDQTVRLVDFETRQSWCLRGHSDWVNHVKIDLPSRTVWSASDDCLIKMWDLDSKTELKTFVGHLGQVQQILLLPDDFVPDGPASQGDGADAVSVSSGRAGTPAAAPQQHARASSSRQETPGAPLTPPQDDRAVYGSVFVSDPDRPLPPKYFLSAGLDNTIRLWSSTGHQLRIMFGHVEGIWALAGHSLRIVTGANDNLVKLWETTSGKCERTFVGHSAPVTCVGLSDSRMASGSEDCDVRVYSFEDTGGDQLEEWGTPS